MRLDVCAHNVSKFVEVAWLKSDLYRSGAASHSACRPRAINGSNQLLQLTPRFVSSMPLVLSRMGTLNQRKSGTSISGGQLKVHAVPAGFEVTSPKESSAGKGVEDGLGPGSHFSEQVC